MKIYNTICQISVRIGGRALLVPVMSLLLSLTAGCDKTESYSELLRDEEKAVNWYLASQRVEAEIPADGKFITGPDAPFYKMNEDGTVYMRIVDPGDPDDRPEDGDKVYFRFERANLKYYMSSGQLVWAGNMDDLSALGSTYIFYGNITYPSTTQYGEGMQIPLKYVGSYSEVNLILQSYAGFTGQAFQLDQSQCIPYLLKIKYYR